MAAGAVLAPHPLPLLLAILAAPWQRSWLAGSQGLSSMGGRPFIGSEAWEMFIAWPQRCWRAVRGRRGAKAAQAAPQSQLCSSQGHSRGGEEKPLLANTQLRKLCLHSLKACSCGCGGQEDRMPVLGPAKPCRTCRRGGQGHG